jgi:hypothetical protein
MLIQDNVAWDGDLDRKLPHPAALGVDCVAIDLADSLTDGAIDLSEPGIRGLVHFRNVRGEFPTFHEVFFPRAGAAKEGFRRRRSARAHPGGLPLTLT